MPTEAASTTHLPAVTIYDVLDHLRGMATSKAEKGALFERLARAWFLTDPLWVDQFDEVWMWKDWPGNDGQHDSGIDLVARNREDGSLTAVQAKFYEATTPVTKADIDTFLSASGKAAFASRIVITTNDTWSHHAEAAIKDQQISVQRIGLPDLEASRVDWSKFSIVKPEDLTLAPKKQARPHQAEAIDAVIKGFGATDRGQLIMACGTGKTLTSLRLAERLVGAGGTVLYLVPSIALLSQSLREWVSDAEVPLAPLAVCSDPKSTKKVGALEDISVVDLALPATTNTEAIRQRLNDAISDSDRMTVVFSTYQSLSVVHQAVKDGGVDPFDLVLCDEAHRTTGVTLSDADESAFVKVHDPSYLPATRRLYLTATPKLYDEAVKAKAGDADAVLCSMDDEETYGPEFHRLGFGQAVSKGLLADYKVLVLAVDEASVAETFQARMASADNELALDDYAKLIGCWNGLSKRGESEHSFADDPAPMRRAVAFTSSIKASQTLAGALPTIVDEYIDTHDLDVIDDAAIASEGGVSDAVLEQAVIKTAVTHVDGTMSALERNTHVDWLKDTETDTCRILTNVRCLSEGVDVPSLDAVMFLSSRRSVVDVVQAVGRVMRKADGKKYGYIILPVAIPAGKSPEEALSDNKRYQVIWDVLQALRAHDEQFEATVNQIDLNKKRSTKISIIGVTDKTPSDDTTPGPTTETPEKTDPSQNVADQVQLTLELKWPELDNLRDAIYARIVKKVGKRRYWETWAKDVAKIAEAHITRINTLLDTNLGGVADDFATFLTGLQNTLNDSITRTDAVEMLAQHLITRPVFDALFKGYNFAEHNPVSQAMETMLATLDTQNLDVENKTLDKFYDSVRTRATGITDSEGRQRIIVELYDTFFSTAFKRTVDKLGIVYTPIECVDFLLHSADWVLREEFGTSISAENVHVLDGFTGTGTFIVRLLQSGLIAPHDLARKFASELHANEFLLLAYYIAAVNIETAFHDQNREHDDDAAYEPFNGLVLTDTFQAYETGDQQDLFVLPQNNERLKRQLDLPITVIVGNPPYSARQDSANDNNANEKYPQLDQAIRDTYAARTDATNKNGLYDSYIRAIKWASLRLGERGVVAYITNGGWLDGNTAAGLRKCLVEEFSAVHVFNLRGNQRTAGDESRREGGKVFDAGSRATVAMFLLVKNPEHDGLGVVHYRNIGDYLSREDKLALVATAGSFAGISTEIIIPNEDGDWLNQRSADFPTYIPLADKGTPNFGVFRVHGRGVETARDAWVYNQSRTSLEENVNRLRVTYEADRQRIEKSPSAETTTDTRLISWSRSLLAAVRRGAPLDAEVGRVYKAAYRPFSKTNLYLDRQLVNVAGPAPRFYPTPAHNNTGFYLTGIGATKAFSVLATDDPIDVNFWGSEGGQHFARWVWEPVKVKAGQLDFDDPALAPGELVVDGYRRFDNITDHALAHFQAAYGENFTKDDIFAYCYGLLHNSEYRARYAADLKKVLPRIPLVEEPGPYVEAGKTLLDLHQNYEAADRFALGGLDDLFNAQDDEAAYAHYSVVKLRYGKPSPDQKQAGERADKTTIVVNPRITLIGIPEAAQRFMVGSRSGLDWLLDRYQVKVDKPSGIVNDPNDWAREVGDPRYVVDLIARIVTVSAKTMEVIDDLPPLSVRESQGA